MKQHPIQLTRRLLHTFTTFILTACIVSLSIYAENKAYSAEKNSVTNIVLILADDLGYGDVRALNPQGKIETPNMDRLAHEGMTFTDAHSGSSVCTPTRYGLLTGRYSWRTRLQSSVLFGYSPPLIAADRLTVAGLLKQQGYHTACVGKWHLGMNWPRKAGAEQGEIKDGWEVDYSAAIGQGPTTVGFDYYFGISASLDMPPYVYIENDRAVKVPTVEKKWVRQGPAADDFEAVDVLPKLTEKAVAYVQQRAKTGEPFFLYMPLNSPHTPIVPSPEFKGKSGISEYADFVMQTDWSVGQVLKALDDAKLTENTLVIFTSDNGCSPSANFAELAKFGHNPSHLFRGHKADIFDGGHRVPFLVRWPGQVAKNSHSDQLVCLTDIMATCAEISGAKLPANAGEDSASLLPALKGKATTPLHEAVVHHSINGSFAVRQGPWKLCLCPDSGGWSAPRPNTPAANNLPSVQLFNLKDDLGEQQNLNEEHAEVVRRLTDVLEKFVEQGRSTPGDPQKNDAEIQIVKKPSPPKNNKSKTKPST